MRKNGVNCVAFYNNYFLYAYIGLLSDRSIIPKCLYPTSSSSTTLQNLQKIQEASFLAIPTSSQQPFPLLCSVALYSLSNMIRNQAAPTGRDGLVQCRSVTFINAALEKAIEFLNWECYQNFLKNGTPNHICIQPMIQWRHSPYHVTTSIFILLAKSNGVFVELRLGK